MPLDTEWVDGMDSDIDELKNVPLDTEACELYPWEHPEILARELINMFDPKLIVHNAGSGTWGLACARHRRQYLGFTRSAVQLQLCHEAVWSIVVSEMIDAVDDGFRCRRFLSRQRSLAGTEAEGMDTHDASDTESFSTILVPAGLTDGSSSSNDME